MNKKVAAPVQKTEINGRGNRCADHVTTLYPQKLVLTSPTGGDRSVGIVRPRTKATEFFKLPKLLVDFPSYLASSLKKGRSIAVPPTSACICCWATFTFFLHLCHVSSKLRHYMASQFGNLLYSTPYRDAKLKICYDILIRSNEMQQYAGVYLLQNYLHVSGVNRTRHQVYIKL